MVKKHFARGCYGFFWYSFSCHPWSYQFIRLRGRLMTHQHWRLQFPLQSISWTLFNGLGRWCCWGQSEVTPLPPGVRDFFILFLLVFVITDLDQCHGPRAIFGVSHFENRKVVFKRQEAGPLRRNEEQFSWENRVPFEWYRSLQITLLPVHWIYRNLSGERNERLGSNTNVTRENLKWKHLRNDADRKSLTFDRWEICSHHYVGFMGKS